MASFNFEDYKVGMPNIMKAVTGIMIPVSYLLLSITLLCIAVANVHAAQKCNYKGYFTDCKLRSCYA